MKGELKRKVRDALENRWRHTTSPAVMTSGHAFCLTRLAFRVACATKTAPALAWRAAAASGRLLWRGWRLIRNWVEFRLGCKRVALGCLRVLVKVIERLVVQREACGLWICLQTDQQVYYPTRRVYNTIFPRY
jgi:hypothetical protein